MLFSPGSLTITLFPLSRAAPKLLVLTRGNNVTDCPNGFLFVFAARNHQLQHHGKKGSHRSLRFDCRDVKSS
jgi:hypothetical protein